MAFYDLEKSDRVLLAAKVRKELCLDLVKNKRGAWKKYFSDDDTYNRKTAYLQVGRIWKEQKALSEKITGLLWELLSCADFKIRQTVINAAGEIGKYDFGLVQPFFDRGLFDDHHSPRNAVIGCIKKMGEVNPVPVLRWARTYLHHDDPEVRREICHGIELRGRKHPEEILPLLRALEFDKTTRVKYTLVHVLGQIAYKEGCLEIVLKDLQNWQNKDLVSKALDEIVDVHDRYSDFAALSTKEAKAMVRKQF